MFTVKAVVISSIEIGERIRVRVGDLAKLCLSIETVGLLQPVVVTTDYKLVAGLRRIEAFKQLGRDTIPAVVVDNLADALLLLYAERDENTCRESFSPGEFVALGKKLEQLEKPKAKERQGRPGRERSGKLPEHSEPAQTRDKVAAALGVSGKTYEKAKAVVEAAEQDANLGDVVEKMNATHNVDAAYKVIRAAAKEKKQAEAVVQTAALPDDERFRVITGDFRTADVAPASIDCIVTDPPYPSEYTPLYGDLSDFAARVLKPGGSMFVMCGQSYFNELLPLLCRSLTYQWLFAYLTPGGQAVQIWPRKVNTFWKPVVWLVNGTYSGDWKGDVCRSDVNDNDKQHHHWGQSESGMADLVRRASEPGDLICDPFCGGGTTGVVATLLGRRFVGIERDEKVAAAGLLRIHEAQTCPKKND